MFTIIVAIGQKGEIGISGNLIWHIPEDMKFFKETTINHKVVMGRKTFESLPNGKLKDRENIVITRNNSLYLPEDIITIYNFEEFLKQNCNKPEEIFIIGGEKIYNASIPYVNKMFITHIDSTKEDADTFFVPNLSENIWIKEDMGTYEFNKIKYSRAKYIKNK